MNTIHIKFQKIIGQIKPMHGVNNGPLSGSETKDLSRYFRLAGIPLIRFHDTDYPNPQIFLRIRRMRAAMISGIRMCTWRRRMRLGPRFYTAWEPASNT